MTNYRAVWDKNIVRFEQKINDLKDNGFDYVGGLCMMALKEIDKRSGLEQTTFVWGQAMEKKGK
jgi:hypothetical protein